MEFEFTPEQQAHIDSLIAKKTAGLYTKEDLQKEVTREVDRRVETGIQKGLETQKQKWMREFEEQSKLTAEQLAEKQLSNKLKELEARELEVALKSNTVEAKSMLSEANIPKEQYERFVGILVNGDAEATKSNVTNFINTFKETKASLEASIKAEFSLVPPPTGGSGDKAVTKDDFMKMSYEEKLKLKKEQPEVYKKLIG